MGKFDGKVVIITGSSSGIGQAAAVEFAKQGASVTIHGRSDEGLKKTQELLKEANIPESKVAVVKGPIEDDAIRKSLIEETVKEFGKLDVLVNNVGIPGLRGQPMDSMENFDFVFDVNLKSSVRLALLAVPHLETTKGCIVNVSTVGAKKTSPYAPFYGMAKAALDHFARNYAVILAPKGIRVNNVNPGAVWTEFTNRTFAADEAAKAKIYQNVADNCVPLKRVARPEEIAEVIVFVSSSSAAYMTGATIAVDGGASVFYPEVKVKD